MRNALDLTTLEDFKQELFAARPEVKAAYDELEPEYKIIESIIRHRIEKNLTQKQLAEKMGTTQSAIARLEAGNANPSLAFLKRVAAALGTKLVVQFGE